MVKTARSLLFSCLTLAGGALAPPAFAQEAPTLPECTCRANGHNFKLGENICLSTPNGPRMAMCELTQNVTNWRFSDRGCDVSQGTNFLRHSRASVPAACPKPV
ncbi:MAG: hypothetical protein K2P80_06595 [Beijerinckiaceae bacterium]|nr:hypothetical protein [Beijerinckiaceae bacterium]